jgi:uncharacterized Zn-finger protein
MHFEKPDVVCPHCDHEYTADEMNECEVDLWALAPNEDSAELKCPVCDQEFYVQGGYKPLFTTAFCEDELF